MSEPAVADPASAPGNGSAPRLAWIDQPQSLTLACPVCGAGDAKRARLVVAGPGLDPPGLRLLDCAGCGSSFYERLAPPDYESRALAAGLLKFYVEQGAGIDAMAGHLAPFAALRVERFLEVGCGFGFSLDFARFAYGWTVKGLDPSPLAAAGRDLLDLDIDSAYLGRQADLGGQFDLAFCSEVIEHLPAPGDFIRQLAGVLSARGALVLTTPDVEAVARDTPEGVLRNLLGPGEHLILYSAAALRATLLQHGFTHVRVRKQAYSLVAVASCQPLRIRERAALNRVVYRRYLGARAAAAPADSAAAHGMGFRLFKELVFAGSFRKADLAFETLRDSYARVYGIDLDAPSSLTFDGTAGLPFEEFARRHPFNLCGVLHFQGRCELVDRRDARRAIEYFRAAIRAGVAIRAALRSMGRDDGETEDLTGQAQLHIVLGLADVDADAALAACHGAGAPSTSGAAGDGDRLLPSALLARVREELFVRLVGNGALAAGERLLPDLESAASGRAAGPGGLRVALARRALRSRFWKALLTLSIRVQGWSEALGRLSPGVHDYRADLLSLRRRARNLLADPRRLMGMVLFAAGYPFMIARAHLSYYRSRVRRRADFIEERWNGHQDLSSATKIAVFSHFDAGGVLHDFVAYYLRQLAEAGFTTIFVSNAPHLSAQAVDRLRPWCGPILRRANVGYDFGAYKDGLARIPDLRRLETLVLANDSVYGPFHPLKDLLARMDGSADVWGITDSWERHRHLQSYFLLFAREALQSACFARFWARWPYVNSKYWIISRGEIGLSRELAAAGLRCRALVPYRAAAAVLVKAIQENGRLRGGEFDPVQQAYLDELAGVIGRDRAVNGSHYFWDFLITRQGCPFLKRELLRDNPVSAPFIREWELVVGSASAYDTGLIARHLELTMGGRPLPDPVPPGRPYRPWFA